MTTTSLWVVAKPPTEPTVMLARSSVAISQGDLMMPGVDGYLSGALGNALGSIQNRTRASEGMDGHSIDPNINQQLVVMPANGMATAGMVIGAVSMVLTATARHFVCLTCFLSIPMAFLGMVFSHIGLSRARQFGVGMWPAVIGLVLNWLQLLVFAYGVTMIAIGSSSGA